MMGTVTVGFEPTRPGGPAAPGLVANLPSTTRPSDRPQGSIAVRCPTVQDAAALAASLRPADLAESLALGDDVGGMIAGAIRASSQAWVAQHDGRPVCIWGVCEGGSLLAPVGEPWCLTTPLVEQHRRLFARASAAWVRTLRERYPRLEGWVDARHAVAIRWLAWLGFDLSEPMPDVRTGMLWRRFSWERC